MTADTRASDVRADFVRSLGRYRARLILVSAIRYGAVAVVAAIGMAATLIAMTSVERTAIAGSAIVVVVATAGAALLAWLRAPGLREIARAIDSPLRSSNCLVTAVECVNASDPVADLVVREANRRLAAVSPAEIVPIELPRRFPAFVAIAAAVVVAAVIGTKRPPQDPDSAARAAGSSASTSPARSAPSPGQRGGDAAGRAAASASVANAGPQGRDAATPSAARADTAPVGADRNSSTSPLDPSLPASRSSVPQASAAPGRANETAQGAAGSLGAGSRDGRSGAGAAEDAGGGGGRSSGVSARSARGAGGVSGDGATLVAPSHRSSPLRSTMPSAAAYQSAWSQAQAAIARDRIPGDLKQIVKDYFTAIRPQP